MEICRLCLLNNDHYINIFSEFASNKNVAEIIGKHVGEVIESDPLPNYVCIECWKKLENFDDFYTSIKTAQARYLSDLVKYERETNHFVDVSEPIHLNIDSSNLEPIDVLANDELDECNLIKVEYETCKPIFIIDKTSGQIKNETIEYDETTEEDSLEIKAIEQTKEENESVKKARKQLDTLGLLDYVRRTRSNTKYNVCKKEYICDICSQTLSSKQKILDHLLRHGKYMCPICSKRCKNRFTLDAHIKAEHYKEKLEKVKKQLDALKLNNGTPKVPDSNQIKEILAQHYDPSCDFCAENLPPSLEQIQAHYNQQHSMNGYLRCCNNVKLKTIEQIIEHAIFHLHPEYYKCKFCDARFVHGNVLKDFEMVKKHIVRHLTHIRRNLYNCIVCRAGFASKYLLNVHRKYHHEIDVSDDSNSEDSNTDTNHKKYSLADFFTMRCDLCDDAQILFASFREAKQHYRDFHDINGYLVCCSKKFMKPKTIENHFRWHKNPESAFKCQYCGKCFNQKMNLTVHVSKHKAVEEKRFTCPECKKAFYSNHYLKKHMTVHEKKNKKTIPCPHCQKQYTTEQSMEYHIKYAHGRDKDSKGVICEICGKQFVSQTTVKNHIRIVHCTQSELDDRKDPSKRSQCTLCDASFINKYRLKKHVDSIHLAEPVKCELCDKVAPNPAALVCHMKSVHVAQDFQCHLCAKAFKAAAALKDHIATHTGEKLYKCSFCPEAFIWRPNMYSHQKKAHPDEWKSKKTILK